MEQENLQQMYSRIYTLRAPSPPPPPSPLILTAPSTPLYPSSPSSPVSTSSPTTLSSHSESNILNKLNNILYNKQKRINIGNGEFDYIKDLSNRRMLQNGWQAINTTEKWDFLRDKIDSFMYSTDPNINIIYDKMAELGYNGHSGFSFTWTMKNLQTLSRIGEEEYRKQW
jgi:hypothetical protein